MDQSALEKMIRMIDSGNDADAALALRGLQGLFQAEGVTLAAALEYAAENTGAFRAARVQTVDAVVAKPAAVALQPVSVSGMPQCRAPQPGALEIILPGQTAGQVVAIPGAAAEDAAVIAENMKDALVAAVINKSRFKLKLNDIKNSRGDIVETVLQAEYDRKDMTPVRIWSHVRGEVAALAAVLRKLVAGVYPDLVAA